MLVIFLDVDGVLDSHGRKRNHLEASKVSRLVEVVRQTGARIVVSSHWRLVKDPLRHLTEALTYLGVEVIGATPVRLPWEPERPLEIAEWLEAYNTAAHLIDRPHVTGFVAVDDRALLSECGGDGLFGRFVQTDKRDGLDSAAAQRMLLLLHEQEDPLQAAALPRVPGLPSKAELRVKDTTAPGAFGIVRLSPMVTSEERPAAGQPRAAKDMDALSSLRPNRYTVAGFWAGTTSKERVACFGSAGPQPTPWIVVSDTPSLSKKASRAARTSTADALVKKRGFLYRISTAGRSLAAAPSTAATAIRSGTLQRSQSKASLQSFSLSEGYEGDDDDPSCDGGGSDEDGVRTPANSRSDGGGSGDSGGGGEPTRGAELVDELVETSPKTLPPKRSWGSPAPRGKKALAKAQSMCNLNELA
mmetsp:Transcript_56241/g.129126  ORF Transcript_56241/g.129126 Transcript_56241/m.129126 type:complete len:416 (-) Transcript_56241:437-1684(-)